MREGSKNVIRNGWMSFASISSIAISLLILGIFLLLTLNVNYLAQQIEQQVEIKVYLDLNVPKEQIAPLQNEIAALSQVDKVTFVSKDEGLAYLREKLGENGKQLTEGYEGENNPLNDSFTVEVTQPREVASVAQQINAINTGKPSKPIYRVSYGQGTVETLFKVTQIVRYIGLILVAGLALTAMFLIANTIKLTILARRREIAIMKLVGATNSFIRWPFFIEGMLLGLTGSVVPVGLLLYGYYELMNFAQSDFGMLMVKLLPYQQISWIVSGLLLGIGIMIGIWGSMLSVRKFLRV